VAGHGGGLLFVSSCEMQAVPYLYHEGSMMAPPEQDVAEFAGMKISELCVS